MDPVADWPLWPVLDHLERRDRIATRLTSWMRHIPVIGRLVHAFWYCLIYEGVQATLKPRWGALTFAFLNDGMKPTIWHTWRSIVDPDEGIWVGGAPRNAADAERKRAEIAHLYQQEGN